MESKQRPVLLVIDDTPANLKVAVGHLQAFSYDILTARDGESGLGRARLASPDLILLDVQMPGIDGFETCRRLKADPETASIPVIFMTVLSSSADKVRAFDVGAVDYVTKPLEAGELLARVRAHLELRKLQAALEGQAEVLENRVEERTAELQRELHARSLYEREREHLLELVRGQSEQMRQLTQHYLLAQQERDRDLAQSLRDRVAARLGLVHGHLHQALQQAEAWSQLQSEPHAAGRGPSEVIENLRSALELLEPAVQGAEAVQGSLVAVDVGQEANPLLKLSTREYEVLQLLAQGKTNKEIAYTLGVARTTVSTYRTRILEKLGVEDLAALVKLAVRYEGPRES